jgi:hypothetical protein
LPLPFWLSSRRDLLSLASAFIYPYRRCAQDRIAEAIVVTERSYQQRFPPSLGPPPEADAQPQEPPATADPEPSS